MAAIRSVLWIGKARHFAADIVADAPSLDVVWERDAAEAARSSGDGFHVVVLEAEDADQALAALASLAANAGAPVLVRIAPRQAERASELLEAGAADVALRGGPNEESDLLARIERLARPGRRSPDPRIIGRAPAMRRVLGLVAVSARSRATVLLSGETGTGKEVVARAIHAASPRRDAAFIAVNCAAFPDTLLESELFGYQRGAFTGADRNQPGLFEAAHGGTLFLDEIGETSAPFQAKLLRVLQEREVRRIGAARNQHVDVRVVAASNRELRREANEQRFRIDLYYRLAVFPITLPPLRERPGDILALAHHFLARHGPDEGHREAALTPAAEQLLQAHRWPGNVRELENEVLRALAMTEPGEALAPEHFSERLGAILEPIESQVAPGDTLRETLGRIEGFLIRKNLAAHDGQRSATARALGITREGLYKKMKRFGIE
ncbi:MAG: sigma 54-interacting transcriptional regulator [Deltaproteobacteria bacterium]|nr:sigma 54-interacting transcriptional regulator [Deltaproteobacteria bacterium]